MSTTNSSFRDVPLNRAVVRGFEWLIPLMTAFHEPRRP